MFVKFRFTWKLVLLIVVFLILYSAMILLVWVV